MNWVKTPRTDCYVYKKLHEKLLKTEEILIRRIRENFLHSLYLFEKNCDLALPLSLKIIVYCMSKFGQILYINFLNEIGQDFLEMQ